MIIVEKMFSVYLCLLLSNDVLSAEIKYTESNKNYIITQGHDHFIIKKFMSFKLKTCSTAYVALIMLNSMHYSIVIDGLNAESYITDITGNRLRICESRQQVLHCDIYADFFITWNFRTITVIRGLDSNGSVFLTCTFPLLLIFNIGLRTKEQGEWLFNTADILFTPNEKIMNRTTTGDYFIPTDATKHSQKTTTNDLLKLSIGTNIPSQRYTETTEAAEKTTTDGMTTTTDVLKTTTVGMTTTSEDLQSTITIGDTEITDTSAESASTKSTTIPLELVTTPSSLSVGGTTYTEPKTSTCKCNCPKSSVTPTNNDLIDQLKIDKKTLSSYKRRRESATDSRKSSFYIGCIGITVLVISVAFIVLLDCIPWA